MGCDQIVALLLENGADVNSRNYCGQVLDLIFFSPFFLSWVMFFLLFLYWLALILENHGLICSNLVRWVWFCYGA